MYTPRRSAVLFYSYVRLAGPLLGRGLQSRRPRLGTAAISKTRHLRGGDQEVGPMIPKFELWRDFCTMYPATKFHHPMFNRSEVIMLTNKPQTNNRTPLKTSISLPRATPVDNHCINTHYVLLLCDCQETTRLQLGLPRTFLASATLSTKDTLRLSAVIAVSAGSCTSASSVMAAFQFVFKRRKSTFDCTDVDFAPADPAFTLKFSAAAST